MCGIAGLFNFRSAAPVEQESLAEMARRLAHRGPDGEGFFLDGDVGLCHRRLAVIDLEGGRQPMATPDEQVWISYNGEVYNYVELGEELVARGHRLTTHSDTEVVLHAYLEWGLAFPERLNGMFALAIWDAREKRLVLCRDHMGIKPLYVAKTADGVVFGSELKALRAIPGVGVELDRLALDEFMTSGYVVHPRTVVKGVEKVAPGTMQIFQRGKEPVERRYWQLAFRPDHRRRVADWCEEIEATFTEAVRMQLRSDVPLGTLLSGGVDSTVIAATMAELRGGAEGIDSYCVGIDVPGARNEFVHARTVAEGLGLTHHELVLSSEQFGDHMLEAATIMGEPLVEPMVGQLLAVCRHARRRLTVMLSGEGADETWFGYPTYRLHNRIERLQKVVPRRVLQLVDRSVHALAARHLLPPKAAKHAATLIEPLERRYLGLSYFDLGLKASIYSPEMRHHLRDHDSREALRRLYEDGVGGPEVMSRMAALDCRAWLVDNTLMRSDHMSMAASLELRVPFLDHRLVALATRVPAGLKVHAREQKVILKRALAARLPEAVARRPKVGFPTPLAQLFRGSFGDKAEERFRNAPEITRALIDHDEVLRLLARHREGRGDWGMVLCQVLMLEYWAQGFEATT